MNNSKNEQGKLRQWAEKWWKVVMVFNVIGAIVLYLLIKYNDQVSDYLGKLLRSL